MKAYRDKQEKSADYYCCPITEFVRIHITDTMSNRYRGEKTDSTGKHSALP